MPAFVRREADGGFSLGNDAFQLTVAAAGPVPVLRSLASARQPQIDWATPSRPLGPVLTIAGTSCSVSGGEFRFLRVEADTELRLVYALANGLEVTQHLNPSTDGGCTWDLGNQVRVWDATGWTHIGLSRPDQYPRSHDTIAFGAPSLLATQEGELFASWWCTYASLTHLRWARLTLSP